MIQAGGGGGGVPLVDGNFADFATAAEEADSNNTAEGLAASTTAGVRR